MEAGGWRYPGEPVVAGVRELDMDEIRVQFIDALTHAPADK